MSSYHQPIPTPVLALAPLIAAKISEAPTSIVISSFPDNDGITRWSVDVQGMVRAVKVADRRRSDYVICEQVSVFLDATGQEVDRQTERWHRLGDVRLAEESGFPTVAEAAVEEERASERAEQMAAALFDARNS